MQPLVSLVYHNMPSIPPYFEEMTLHLFLYDHVKVFALFGQLAIYFWGYKGLFLRGIANLYFGGRVPKCSASLSVNSQCLATDNL